MPDIYTSDWYEAVKVAINEAVVKIPNAPKDSFTIQVEIVGDGKTPLWQRLVAWTTWLRFRSPDSSTAWCAWTPMVRSSGLPCCGMTPALPTPPSS